MCSLVFSDDRIVGVCLWTEPARKLTAVMPGQPREQPPIGLVEGRGIALQEQALVAALFGRREEALGHRAIGLSQRAANTVLFFGVLFLRREHRYMPSARR